MRAHNIGSSNRFAGQQAVAEGLQLYNGGVFNAEITENRGGGGRLAAVGGVAQGLPLKAGGGYAVAYGNIAAGGKRWGRRIAGIALAVLCARGRCLEEQPGGIVPRAPAGIAHAQPPGGEIIRNIALIIA